jgi:hypothetical protein
MTFLQSIAIFAENRFPLKRVFFFDSFFTQNCVPSLDLLELLQTKNATKYSDKIENLAEYVLKASYK